MVLTDPFPLLPQHVQTHPLLGARLIGKDDDVVAIAVDGPKTIDAPRGQQFLADNAIEKLLGVVEQLLGFHTHDGIGKDLRILPF